MQNLLNMDLYNILATAIVLFTAIPVHEYSHARVAVALGDDTPIMQGRLTLNPFAHLSLIGSIALFLFGFGWANPVRVDVKKLQHPKRDMALIALAGPVSNILIALVVMIIFKFVGAYDFSPLQEQKVQYIYLICTYVIMINIRLAVFNFLPIPPLDGSRIVGGLLPGKIYYAMYKYEGVITVVMLLLLYTGILGIPLNFLSSLLIKGLDFITSPIDMLLGR